MNKWENQDYFLYGCGDSDHSQILIGSQLAQDPSSDYFSEPRHIFFCIWAVIWIYSQSLMGFK